MALPPGTIVVADPDAFGGTGGLIAVDPVIGRQLQQLELRRPTRCGGPAIARRFLVRRCCARMDPTIPSQELGMEELFIVVAPAVMGVGLWLILRQKPDKRDDDDAPTPG
jgi:hypothetical protein